MIAVFALLTDTPDQYLSVRNFRIVVAQTVIVALGAIGMTMIIVSGGIDLSVGSVIALTGVVTAHLDSRRRQPAARRSSTACWPAAWSACSTALLITRLRVIPFIATLGTLGMARGVAKWIAGQQTVNVPPTWVNELAVTFPQPEWLIVAPGVWLSVALAVLASLVLRYTVFGRRVFAVGSNEAAARACGIAVDRLKIWIYGLAGLLFGLSGVMQMSRLRQGDPTVAIGTELDIIAAVVIGGGSLSGGVGHDPRIDDRRDHHGRAAQRQPADGLAQLHPGDHHRRDHRDRRRRRRLALAPALIMSSTTETRRTQRRTETRTWGADARQT